MKGITRYQSYSSVEYMILNCDNFIDSMEELLQSELPISLEEDDFCIEQEQAVYFSPRIQKIFAAIRHARSVRDSLSNKEFKTIKSQGE